MKRYVVYVTLGSAAVMVSQHALFAQQAESTRVASATHSGISEASRILQQPVSIRLHDVSLKRAVDAVVAKTHARMQYQGHLLDAITVPVSIDIQDMPLGAALEQILRGTNLYVTPSVGDLLTIKARADNGQQKDDEIIVGKITHANTQQPVAGAIVTVEGSTHSVTTGTDGSYRLPVKAGQHTVVVRAVGYVRQSKSITISSNGTVTLNWTMQPSTNVLSEVVVTGTVVAAERKEITTPITVIKGDELERRGITRLDQILRGEVPGLYAAERGMSAFTGGSIGNGRVEGFGTMEESMVYSRGASRVAEAGTATPLKTYVDGIEITDGTYLGTIDPQSIDRVEIVVGPQAATIYGSGAMGGVMQIFLKKGADSNTPEFRLNLRYGVLENSLSSGLTPSHNHNLGVMGRSGANFSYAANASYVYTGQWQPLLFSRRYGGSIGGTMTQGDVTVDGSVSLTRGTNGTVAGSGNLSSPLLRERSESGENSINTERQLISQRIAGSQSQILSLSVNYRPFSFWQHSITMGRNQNEFDLVPEAPRFRGAYDSLYASVSSFSSRLTWGYNTTAQFTPTSFLTSDVIVGVSGSAAKSIGNSGCQSSVSSSALLPCNFLNGSLIEQRTLKVDKSAPERSVGGFLNLRAGLFEQLFLTFGARAENNNRYGRDRRIDWTPTTGIAYNLSIRDVTVKFMGSYGKATRAPDAEMRDELTTILTITDPPVLYVRYENPELQPEYSRGPQFGFEAYWGNHGSLLINRYHQTIDHLIQSVVVDTNFLTIIATGTPATVPISQYLNTGTVKSHGWEATGTANIWRMSLKGTYTWSDSRVTAVNPMAAGAVDVGSTFRRIPTHTANVQATYTYGKTSVSWITNWTGTSNWDGLYNPTYLSQVVMPRITTYTGTSKAGQVQWAKASYAKSDLSVVQRLSQRASATLNVTNVANNYKADVDPSSFPSLGRQTLLGVQLRF